MLARGISFLKPTLFTKFILTFYASKAVQNKFIIGFFFFFFVYSLSKAWLTPSLLLKIQFRKCSTGIYFITILYSKLQLHCCKSTQIIYENELAIKELKFLCPHVCVCICITLPLGGQVNEPMHALRENSPRSVSGA